MRSELVLRFICFGVILVSPYSFAAGLSDELTSMQTQRAGDPSQFLAPGTTMSPILYSVLASSRFSRIASQLESRAPGGKLLVSSVPSGNWEPVPGTNGAKQGLWVYLRANTGDTIVGYVVAEGSGITVDSVYVEPQTEAP